jgi:hypothetical protein
MRNVSDKSCKENQNILFAVNPPKRNCTIDEIMWKNVVEKDRSQMAVWSVCIACWIPKPTNTHLEYVIFVALPLQQWLHKFTSLLHDTLPALL